jgi:microcompartment protein CcmL/EutN
VADAAVKKAPVRLLMTEHVTPGKFLVLGTARWRTSSQLPRG